MNTPADIALHLRLLADDPTAPDECVARWLPDLIKRLSFQFRDLSMSDEHIITSAALEAIFNYTLAPARYDPERSTLAYYLGYAAERDVRNALSRNKTQGRGAISIHLVEQWLSGGNNTFEESVIDKADAQAVWESVMLEIADPLDRQLLSLILQGERATTPYAALLGIQHLPEQEQKKIVKRNKDRINRRLERLGDSMNGR